MWYLTELCSKPKNLAPKGEVFRSMYDERAKTTSERWLHISSMCCTIMEGAPHWLTYSWFLISQVSSFKGASLYSSNIQFCLPSVFSPTLLSFLLPSSLLLHSSILLFLLPSTPLLFFSPFFITFLPLFLLISFSSFFSSFLSSHLPLFLSFQISTICFSSWASHAVLKDNYRTSNRIKIIHRYLRTHRQEHTYTHTYTLAHTHVFHGIINNKCTTKTRHLQLHYIVENKKVQITKQ